jgi:hypothetical protein
MTSSHLIALCLKPVGAKTILANIFSVYYGTYVYSNLVSTGHSSPQGMKKNILSHPLAHYSTTDRDKACLV